jgi:hypothetical protein
MALLVCLYFELIVAARCYADWNQWRVKARIGTLRAQVLIKELKDLRLETKTTAETAMQLFRQEMPDILEDQEKWLEEKRKREEFGKLVDERRKLVLKIAPEFLEFEDRFQASSNIRLARLLLESFFPLLFGYASIILAVNRISSSFF